MLELSVIPSLEWSVQSVLRRSVRSGAAAAQQEPQRDAAPARVKRGRPAGSRNKGQKRGADERKSGRKQKRQRQSEDDQPDESKEDQAEDDEDLLSRDGDNTEVEVIAPDSSRGKHESSSEVKQPALSEDLVREVMALLRERKEAQTLQPVCPSCASNEEQCMCPQSWCTDCGAKKWKGCKPGCRRRAIEGNNVSIAGKTRSNDDVVHVRGYADLRRWSPQAKMTPGWMPDDEKFTAFDATVLALDKVNSSAANKVVISNAATWAKLFALYMVDVVKVFPQDPVGMAKYMAYILTHSESCKWPTVQLVDRKIRQQLSGSPINTDRAEILSAANVYLVRKDQSEADIGTICERCGIVDDHHSQHCPTYPSSVSSKSGDKTARKQGTFTNRSSAGGGTTGISNTQCRNFNMGECQYFQKHGKCRWAHTCIFCGGDHSGVRCTGQQPKAASPSN